MVDISKQDYERFFVSKPDEGFSAARNIAIVEKTIKATDANYLKKRKEWNENLAERVDLVSSYIRHLVHKNDATPFEKFAGKEYIARLRGERRLAKIRNLAHQKGYL